MQAIRRSDRIRNRIRNNSRRFLQNERTFEAGASLPNLHMGGDGNNMLLDETGAFDAEVNPNIGDFIPNDQGNAALFEEFPRRRINCRLCILASLKLMIIISVIITILFSAELFAPSLYVVKAASCWVKQNHFWSIGKPEFLQFLDGYIAKQQIISTFLSKSRNYNMNNLEAYSIKYSTDRLVKINRQIKYLNRKLKLLADALKETRKWRESIKNELKAVRNETLQMSVNQVEKFHLKIEEALILYDADKVGITDYALESAGGYIISTPETIPFPSRFSYDLMGIVNIHYPSNPRLLIQPETLPGQCFAFKGSQGRIRIGLAHFIDITSVTLEHAYPRLVDDTSSAPKDFKVYGLLSANREDKHELGSFTYRIEKKPLQRFPIEKVHKERKGYEHIELEIITNHGNPKYTCVYRLRVHGNKLV